MANGWGGSDPTQFNDSGSSYELGTRFVAGADISVTAVRVWHGASSGTLSGRTASIWSSSGTQLREVALPDALSSGWTEFALGTALTVASGTTIWVSYGTRDFYGAVVGAFSGGGVASGDGNVTATAGAFNGTPGAWPGAGTTGTAFYGVDIVYTVSGANVAPVIGATAATSGLTVGLTITVADEAPATVSYDIDWGDGSAVTTTTSETPSHTYSAPGAYPISILATDEGGLCGAAAVIGTALPSGTGSPGMDLQAVVDGVVSLVQASGDFGSVTGAEAVTPPTGDGTLSACAWVEGIRPIPGSGLDSTSIVLDVLVRLHASAATVLPDEAVEPPLLRACSRLLAAIIGDLTLGLEAAGVRTVDVRGMHGVPLGARGAYVRTGSGDDAGLLRAYVINIPVVINDEYIEA